MPKPSNRNQLVSSGVGTLFRVGYANAGVREITADAGVPLGSFTNHFRSKEAFALEVVDHYFSHIGEVIGRTLEDSSLKPSDRLRAYLDVITGLMGDAGWRYGCLIGNMSLEAAEHSEAIRARLVEIFSAWKKPFARVVREAQIEGDLSPSFDPDDLAEFLLAGWHGAILRMKVERSPEPLERFRRVVEAAFFASQGKD
ncbi:MAG: TetR family transcriptional regulator C-terminal domain-containing protein [Beijerinckiaceae bacterium]|jgi:TetR/AcrR family transcriptional repressor of nem operon|nr:TetR family transcriptional regulator C-terminal domain-containing protein [Beijerinckiaceae bacterium]